MLTPEDLETLEPKFEEIRRLLGAARIARKRYGESEEAYGYYVVALGHMENLVEEAESKQGHKVMDALRRAGDVANSPEGAGAIGAVAAGASVPAFVTGLGGFGVVAGGTAFGVAGLAGATAATGGVALAGAAAAYLSYRAGAAALETEPGQRAKDQVVTRGREAVDQAKSMGRDVRQGLSRVRGRISKSENSDLPE